MRCSVEGTDSSGVETVFNDDEGVLEVLIPKDTLVEDLVISCSLPWSGVDEELRLQWEGVGEVDLEEAFEMRMQNDRQLKKASLSRKKNGDAGLNVTTKAMALRCGVADPALFAGTSTPKSCGVVLKTKTGGETEEQ